MQTPLSAVIPPGEWLPDQPDINNPGAIMVMNAIPQGPNYIAFQKFMEATNALPEKCLGGVAVRDRNQNVYFFAGTASNLWRLDGSSWTAVGRSGGYTTAEGERWVFALYGNLLVAANYSDDTQKILLGTDTAFATLPGAPRARTFQVVNEFVVAGDTFDTTDGAMPERLRWCGIGDPFDWSVGNQTTLADLQDTGSGGAVRRIVGYDSYAVVFQAKAIRRMQFQGVGIGFSIEVAEPNRGTVAGGSVCNDGTRIFFYDEDGFYQFATGGSVSISAKKVSKWFKNDLRAGTEGQITSAINPFLSIAAWAYVSNNSPDGNPDRILVYSWENNRFTFISQPVQVVLTALSTTKTIEEIGAQYGNLEDIPFSLDSPLWAGGKTLPGAIGANGKLGYFNGQSMEAVIIGSESRLNTNGRAFVSSVYPVTDADVEASILSRDSLKDVPISSGSLMYQPGTGEFLSRVDAQMHRYRMVLNNWTYFQGVQFRAKATGGR